MERERAWTVMHQLHDHRHLIMAAGTMQASSSSRPSGHAQRYDRQLRLWASSGQASLESAKVAVLGASYLGACVLKNVVLPGMGTFDLIDARTVDEADLGSNFFIGHDAKGKSRAQEVTRNLCELNPQVQGRAIEQEPLTWVETSDLDAYTLIIAINQPNSVLFPLADRAWQANAGVGVPLMTVTGSGLVGSIGVQVKEAGIIETHPDNTIDLRLTRPWPELLSYAQTYDVDTSDSMTRSHTPFIVILIRTLQEWTQSHEGSQPQPSKDRKAFTDSVNAFRQAANADDENVDEAIAALGQHVWRPIAVQSTIPAEIAALLDDEACLQVTDKSSNFWLLVRALREFVRDGDGTLPLPGSLPDMKAQSSTYVELQHLYRAKAASDVGRLRSCLETVLQQVGLPVNAISADELESFAKHAAYLKLIRGHRLRDRIEAPDGGAIALAFMDAVNPITIPLQVALLAAEDFFTEHKGRYPGADVALSLNVIGSNTSLGQESSKEVVLEQDEDKLVQLAKRRLAKWGVELEDDQESLVEDSCAEVTRAGHADLPSTSALLGGVAAQESIKLVTRQYVPLDNTSVYDGIKQAIGVFRL